MLKDMEIRPLEKTDLPLRVQWMNHPKVFRSMHFQLPVLLENTEKWYASILQNENRFDCVFVLDNKVVAMGGLTNRNPSNNKAELYIFVDPDAQKSGLGTQATRLLCRYGFTVLHLEKIYLITNEDNLPAQKVYAKCGFVLEGKLRNEYLNEEGKYLSRFYYGLLKKEWNEQIG